MNFTFKITYMNKNKKQSNIVQRKIVDVIGEYNQVPFGDTYVNEEWYTHDCKYNDDIFEQVIQEIKDEYEADGFTDVSVISCSY